MKKTGCNSPENAEFSCNGSQGGHKNQGEGRAGILHGPNLQESCKNYAEDYR